jgi:hypothetical protein
VADYENLEEVYLYFGMTALAAQAFEQMIILALDMCKKKREVRRLLGEDGELSDVLIQHALERLTLGALVKLFREAFDVDQDLAMSLAEAVKLRNSLMHGYFPRNMKRMVDPDSRGEVLRELNGAGVLFHRMVKKVGPMAADEAARLLHYASIRQH